MSYNRVVKRGPWLAIAVIIHLFFQLVTAQTGYNLTYDAVGNLVQGLGKYYEYDNYNQLKTVRQNNATGNIIAEYFYDYEGKRIKKIEYEDITNTTTYYIDENFIQIVNSTSKFNTTYYYQDGDLVARKDNNEKKFYYHPDQLGSTSLVTNESGSITEEEFYLSYGETLEGNEESMYLFNGKEKDGTNLYYYGARYYDPFSKRFIQPDNQIQDIYNPQDLNRYSYVRNNPYKYTDPSGNIANLVTGLVGAGVGVALGGAISIGSQLYSTGQVSWSDVGKSTLTGAAVGGIGGLTFGLGAAALGVSSFGELSFGTTIGLSAISGITSGRVAQTTSNIFSGQPITQNLLDPDTIVRDATIGAVTGAVIKGISGSRGEGLSLKGNYPASYKAELQSVSIFFKEQAPKYKFNEHSLNSVLGRINQGRIPSKEAIVDALKSEQRFYDARYPGTMVLSKNNVRVHINPKTNEVITVTEGPLSSSRFSPLNNGGVG